MELPDGGTLMHLGQPYDPAKAHEYYIRTRQLKGRDKASVTAPFKATAPKKKDPPQVKPITAKTAEHKLNEIRRKLDLLKRQGHQGPGDFQKRTAAEKSQQASAKSAQAKKAQSEKKAAADEARAASGELADLNQALKTRMAQRAPASEISTLNQSVKDAKKKLDAAVSKLRDLNKATESG